MEAAKEGITLVPTDAAALLDAEERRVQPVELIASFIAKLAEERGKIERFRQQCLRN